jgi:hypothetical protein
MTLSSVLQRLSATICQPIKPEAHKKLNQAIKESSLNQTRGVVYF